VTTPLSARPDERASLGIWPQFHYNTLELEQLQDEKDQKCTMVLFGVSDR
jgi:hypothetical protein